MEIDRFIFSTLIPQGYKLLPADEATAEGAHHLFGPHAIAGAECPNCRDGFLMLGHKPLLHLATIDTRDARLGLEVPLAQIPLLYCTRCAISEADGDVNLDGLRRHYTAKELAGDPGAYRGEGCEFLYHIASEKQVSILVYNRGYGDIYLPYPDYPDAFPGAPARLEAVSAEVQWYNQRKNRYWEEHLDEWHRADYEAMRAFTAQYEHLENCMHQLGGEPDFVNPPAILDCPCCGKRMPFLAVIEDNPNAGTPNLSGSAYWQIVFHYCVPCSVIGSYVLGT